MSQMQHQFKTSHQTDSTTSSQSRAQLPDVQEVSFSELPAMFTHVGQKLQQYLSNYNPSKHGSQSGAAGMYKDETNNHSHTRSVLNFAIEELAAIKGVTKPNLKDSQLPAFLDNFGTQLAETMESWTPSRHPASSGAAGMYKDELIAHGRTRTLLDYVVAEISATQSLKNSDTPTLQSASINDSLTSRDRKILSKAAELVNEAPAYFIDSPLHGGYYSNTEVPVIHDYEMGQLTSKSITRWACNVLDKASSAMAQLATVDYDKVPSGFENEFRNGSGYIQHTSASVAAFLENTKQMLTKASQNKEAKLLEKNGLGYKAPRHLEIDPLLSETLERIERIDPRTLREWGSSYVARELSDDSPQREGEKHRVLKAIPKKYLLPAGRDVEPASVEESKVYSVGTTGFLNHEHALGHARDLVISAQLSALLKDPQFPVIHYSAASLNSSREPAQYIEHSAKKLTEFKELLAHGVFLALQDTQYKNELKTDSLDAFMKNKGYFYGILQDYGNPLAPLISRLDSIDEKGREWNLMRLEQKNTDMLVHSARKVNGVSLTFEKALAASLETMES